MTVTVNVTIVADTRAGLQRKLLELLGCCIAGQRRLAAVTLGRFRDLVGSGANGHHKAEKRSASVSLCLSPGLLFAF